MLRVTLAGAELVGLERGAPGSSVRLLLPGDDGRLELPTWTGNEFRRADGGRARIRTLTPLAVRDDGSEAELDVDVVLHDEAPLTVWARPLPGNCMAISLPGRIPAGRPLPSASRSKSATSRRAARTAPTSP